MIFDKKRSENKPAKIPTVGNMTLKEEYGQTVYTDLEAPTTQKQELLSPLDDTTYVDFEAPTTPPVISANAPSRVDTEALADMEAYSSLREKRKQAKRKKTVMGVTAIVVGLVVLIGGGMWLAGSMMTDPNEGIVPQTALVERGTFSDAVSASGKLTPVSSVSATPEIDGLVGEVYVSEGDAVAAGQPLYTIVNDDLDKAITQAQQVINEANNGVEAAKLAVSDAQHAKSSGIAAAEAAAGEEGPATPFDVAQADSAIRQAELSLSNAYLALSDAQAAYDNAVATAGKRTVVSPIDGSVVSVGIEPGSSLGGAGSTGEAPVQIANLSQMLVSVEVNEIDILKISVDQMATLSFSAIPELELQGKVSHIATVNTGADINSGGMGAVTYTVNILIEAPDPRLKPGMTGKASIESKRLEDVLMVPLSAVMMLSETEGSVLVVDPDNPDGFEERKVTILASDGLKVAVEGNLKTSDELMLIGTTDMMGGTGVEDTSTSSTSSGTVISVG